MLREQVDKLEFLRDVERVDEYTNVKCFMKPENNFNIYIFTNIYENQIELKDNWRNINNDTAFFFQSKLEQAIERWNLYIIYFVKEKIDKKIKYLIEQDKYCARKLVIDNFTMTEYENNLDEIICNKIFDINLASPKEYTYSSMTTLIKEHDECLFKLLLTPDVDINNVVNKYLEEVIYED